jgi:hypothetical protein
MSIQSDLQKQQLSIEQIVAKAINMCEELGDAKALVSLTNKLLDLNYAKPASRQNDSSSDDPWAELEKRAGLHDFSRQSKVS